MNYVFIMGFSGLVFVVKAPEIGAECRDASIYPACMLICMYFYLSVALINSYIYAKNHFMTLSNNNGIENRGNNDLNQLELPNSDNIYN